MRDFRLESTGSISFLGRRGVAGGAALAPLASIGFAVGLAWALGSGGGAVPSSNSISGSVSSSFLRIGRAGLGGLGGSLDSDFSDFSEADSLGIGTSGLDGIVGMGGAGASDAPSLGTGGSDGKAGLAGAL